MIYSVKKYFQINIREWLVFAPVYLGLSLINLIVKLRVTPEWTNGSWLIITAC